MKRIISFGISIILCLSLSFSAFAIGDPNMDGGGGGGLGNGTSDNVWGDGNGAADGCPGEGIRVSVVNKLTQATIGKVVDFTNINWNVRKQNPSAYGTGTIRYCTSGRNKLSYISNQTITLEDGEANYTYWYNPPERLPQIIKQSSGGGNIEIIKRYFAKDSTVKTISIQTGINYDTLISGNYKIMLEPVVYLTFNGDGYALTATEAAVINKKLKTLFPTTSTNWLSYWFNSITQQNLPLAMFLDENDPYITSIPAWTGSTTNRVDDDSIISRLGVGLISFDGAIPEPPAVDTWDYTYTCDTDVITAVSVSSAVDIAVDHAKKHSSWDGSDISDTGGDITVDFDILGSIYRVDKIYMPAGSNQLVWVKWHTPTTPQQIDITVSASEGNISNGVIHANIVELIEKIPPDPTAARSEQVKNFPIPTTYDNVSNRETASASWQVNVCYWQYDWQYVVVDEDEDGEEIWEWVDYGDYVWGIDTYNINLQSITEISPDSLVPTARGKTMKSGYGIDIDTSYSVTSGNFTDGMVGLTPNVITTFPEFNYGTYNRILEKTVNGKFEFKNNKYSTYNKRVHFTPLWFSDGIYRAEATMQDIWTPVGLIKLQTTDFVNIDGNLYDDYYVHLADEEKD